MFRAIKEYKITVGGSASAALKLDLPTDPELLSRGDITYRMRAKTTDVVVKFGDNTVAAASGVTDSKRPDGNFSVAAGSIETFAALKGQAYISTIAEDGSSSGVLFVTLGVHGEE